MYISGWVPKTALLRHSPRVGYLSSCYPTQELSQERTTMSVRAIEGFDCESELNISRRGDEQEKDVYQK